MLVDEGACRFGVAFHADRVTCNTAAQSLLLEGAVWIMAIAAAYEPFVHLVMKGLCKVGLYISVAGVAKLWL